MFKREIIEKETHYEINIFNPHKNTVLIDKDDYSELRGRVVRVGRTSKTNNCQYASVSIRGIVTPLHIFIMGRVKGLSIDHINHNGLDNRKANLRHATYSQNKQNCPSKSIYGKGVQRRLYAKGVIKYRARIRLNGELYNLGQYDTVIDAAKAYNIKAKEFFGDFAYLNEIP